jgi:RNase P/RNase MRP subunit POP5
LLKRVKRRYLAICIDSDDSFDSRVFMDAVWGAVGKLYGEYGASKSGLTLIDYYVKEKLAVIRVWLVAVDMVRAALASITAIGNKHVALHVLSVSGTIKALYGKIK